MKSPTEPLVQIFFVRETNPTNVLVFFCRVFSLASEKMDSPIQIASIRMGLPITCFKESQVDFPNKYVLQLLKIAFIIANSAEPDEMQITKLPFWGFPIYKGFIPHYQMSSIKEFLAIRRAISLNETFVLFC